MNHNAKLGGMHLGRKAAAPITPCVKTQMRDRRMVGQLAIFDCRISTDVLRSMSF